jgi:hypothetical protein
MRFADGRHPRTAPRPPTVPNPSPRKAVIGEQKLSDQFLTQEVENPRLAYLGVPVDKNGEGMWNEDVHLALYDIPPFELVPWKTVYIRDQFQKSQQLTAMRSVFLPVPSKKTVL